MHLTTIKKNNNKEFCDNTVISSKQMSMVLTKRQKLLQHHAKVLELPCSESAQQYTAGYTKILKLIFKVK